MEAPQYVTFNKLSKITGIPHFTLRRHLTDIKCIRAGQGKTTKRLIELSVALAAIKKWEEDL